MSIAEGIHPMRASTKASGTAPDSAVRGHRLNDERSAFGRTRVAAASVESASSAITSLMARSRKGNRPASSSPPQTRHSRPATAGIGHERPKASFTRKAVNITIAS